MKPRKVAWLFVGIAAMMLCWLIVQSGAQSTYGHSTPTPPLSTESPNYTTDTPSSPADPSEPTNTETLPIEPVPTAPNETESYIAEPTQTDPTEPGTQHSEPESQSTGPVDNEPKETTPTETESDDTAPPTSDPPITEPTEPPHTHSYSVTVISPTCDMGGYTVHICSCGKSYTDCETSALGHSYTETVVEPTFDSEGYTEYICVNCGHAYRDNYTQKIPAPTEPSINESTGCDMCGAECKITVVPATPEEEGYTLYECPSCGYYVFKHFVSYGHSHDYRLIEVWEPTCLNPGHTFYECECGDTLVADITAALGHDFSESNICSRCGYSEESLYSLDYEAAMAYGNQYAVDTYGWYIDLDLNYDNAGFNFPSAPHKDSVIARGGQPYLHQIVESEIDNLYETILDRGNVGIPYINCHVYEDSSGVVFVYIYYG